MSLLAGIQHGITAQESWDVIESWLKTIGKKSQVDMKKDVFVFSAKLGTDTNGDYYTLYDHIKELDEMDADVGAFISNNLCHIQLAANGIYSMSDGKMTKYLGMKEGAARDVFGYYTEDTVESGTLEELGNKKYQLIDAEMTVSKGVQMVKSYFEKGTPFSCATGVTVDVPQVNIFRLGEVYGYDYTVRMWGVGITGYITKQLLGSFLYGIATSVFGIGVAIIFRDKYMLICLPFLFSYVYNQILNKLAADDLAVGGRHSMLILAFKPEYLLSVAWDQYWIISVFFLLLVYICLLLLFYATVKRGYYGD